MIVGERKPFDEIKESIKDYEKILILLDADAYRESIKHLRRTRSLLMGVGIRRLERDIKDMSYKEIQELLEKENPE